MTEDVESELREILALVEKDDYEAALPRLDNLLANNPCENELWFKRRYVMALQRKYEGAVEDISRAITICPGDPSYFITRGRHLFRLKQFKEALSDFTRTLELCEETQSDYYRRSAYFARAEVYLKLGDYGRAIADCSHLPDDFRTWTDQLRAKRDIIEECEGKHPQQ